MNADSIEGFRELSHPADMALEAWAPSLSGLFIQTALGMYSLLMPVVDESHPVTQELEVSADDTDALLVAFLSRLLYTLEKDKLVFNTMQLDLKVGRLKAILTGFPMISIQREIKAVTFNDLAIRRKGGKQHVSIVFDV